MTETRPPLPPFTHGSATEKVQKAEDAWNSRDPDRCAAAYTVDSVWRNRAEFFSGREAIRAFLHRKWEREFDYRLKKELWSFPTTASRSASSTNATTRPASGGAATATSSGNSTATG